MANEEGGEIQGATWMNLKGENDLDKLILKSEIMDQGKEKFDRLVKNVKWMGTGYEFLWMAENTKSEEYKPGKAVVLGLGNFYDSPFAMAEFLNGKTWIQNYGEYGYAGENEGVKDQTALYMKGLAADPKIKSIIFLVPPELFSHPGDESRQQVTKEEMRFLMENLEFAKKVYLVFGAYEMVDKEKFDRELGIKKGKIKDINPTARQIARLKLSIDFEKFVKMVQGK